MFRPNSEEAQMKRSIVSLFTVAVLSSAISVAATGGAFAHEGAPTHDYEVELGNAPVCDTQPLGQV
jgi:hypothetical protein